MQSILAIIIILFLMAFALWNALLLIGAFKYKGRKWQRVNNVWKTEKPLTNTTIEFEGHTYEAKLPEDLDK